MDRSHYLHVHLPGRGRLTLSFPAGVERAIIRGRITADAEVWYEQINLWVSIARHPGLAGLLSLVQLPATDCRRRAGKPVPMLDDELPPKVAVVPPPPVAQVPDPAQLPLIPLDEADEYHEFSEFLKRSSEAEKRVLTVRSSGPLRVSGPARVVVAGATDPPPRTPAQRLLSLFPRYLVPGWAASVALTLLSSLALGLLLMRSGGAGDEPAPVIMTNALSAGGRAPDSSTTLMLPTPNPLAEEERELETNLRVAEAVVWQPALDFSPELIGRSVRKVDAVRNSISLYRIGAWRQIDSAARDSTVLLESYEESTRVDEILNLVQSAVSLLDSLHATFRVSGEVLVFSDPEPAARYGWLRHRADSLLRTPVESDSLRPLRAPRRVTGRLLETLPTAVVRPLNR